MNAPSLYETSVDHIALTFGGPTPILRQGGMENA